MNECITVGCVRPRLSGRGRRFCVACRAEADERRRLGAIRRSKEWREANPIAYVDSSSRYYKKTAEVQRARAGAWYYANPERVRANRAASKARKTPRVHKYGLSPKGYFALLDSQGGGCAICGRTENGKRHNFDVDHDHDTGAIRGLLCNRCNRLLSNARDSTMLLERAAQYLMQSQRATEPAV